MGGWLGSARSRLPRFHDSGLRETFRLRLVRLKPWSIGCRLLWYQRLNWNRVCRLDPRSRRFR
ncbi:hypothetical protein SBA3_1230001 [Candidatus Sulfopaludibacter sp. SbA3]|nr:hypothetical protein SBA3_1230001 [Candidatus Sulfopaludibacter sp. SbA3]